MGWGTWLDDLWLSPAARELAGTTFQNWGEKDAAQRRHSNPALNHITGKRTRWLCGGGNNAIPIWRLSVVMMVMTMTKMMMSMTMTMTMTMMMTTKTTGDNTWQQLPDGTKCSGPPKYFPDPDNCRMFYFCYRGCFTHNTVLMGPFSYILRLSLVLLRQIIIWINVSMARC